MLGLKSFSGQAYDGHMNLILSDVEETIMIVDVAEGAPDGQGTVNVSQLFNCSLRELSIFTGSQTQNGYAVR
jgi:small nuclear ribonucleoprotein (snRNP)-like protein